jgi:hypothetical protein
MDDISSAIAELLERKDLLLLTLASTRIPEKVRAIEKALAMIDQDIREFESRIPRS